MNPTLQVKSVDGSSQPNIFALGDVAEHGGPRMARAVFLQSGIVRDNLLKLINGRSNLQDYTPQVWIEGAVQLTIGKVSYSQRNLA